VPVGVSVHAGLVYVGIVGSKDSVNEIAVLGNEANLAARLSSQAAQGEVVVSETAESTAGLASQEAEQRTLELKGISQPVSVQVLRVAPRS
jgi:class 3 adenylate cyclase